jgi:hypothetical protein
MSHLRRNTSLFLLIPYVSSLAMAADEVMPTMPRRIERTQPDDTALQITGERQREMEAVDREMKAKRRAFETGQPAATQETPRTSVIESAAIDASERVDEKAPKEAQGERQGEIEPPSKPRNSKATPGAFKPVKQRADEPASSNGFRSAQLDSQYFTGGSPLQVFAVSKATESEFGTYTVLPTGSHVKARIVSGVEANAREPYPVLLQLDYAFTGPNKTRIDLSHCFMIAKARANMSTERVMMETENLSCVRDDGEHFKREAKGYVAGDDNTFGATGTYISKQGQVLLAAVLASIAKNAGQAIADAQKTTSVLGADKAASAANITGSKAAFVGGSALVDGGAMVAQWYLEQAKELLPSIGVGSGQDVFVVMLDSIKVPQIQSEE